MPTALRSNQKSPERALVCLMDALLSKGLILLLLIIPSLLGCGRASTVSAKRPDNIDLPPVISIATQPLGQSLNIGQQATFSVVATTDKGELGFQWYRMRGRLGETTFTAIPEAVSSSYTTPILSEIDDTAVYFSRITCGPSVVDTVQVVLSVTGVPTVTIVTQPVAQTLYAGQTATLTVTASSNVGSLSYQWCRQRPGAGEPNYYLIPGATSASFTTEVLTLNDHFSGYFARITCGSKVVDTDHVAIRVMPEPVVAIKIQPLAQNLYLGQRAYFTVGATTSGITLSYQWYQKRVGETSFTGIPNASSASYLSSWLTAKEDLSEYFVRVACGAVLVESAHVVLTVKPVTSTYTLPGQVSLDLLSIPGGMFTMGSPVDEKDRLPREGPVHVVTLNPFYMGKSEITQAQWQAVMGSNPSHFSVVGGGSTVDDLSRPVEQVSWNDIEKAGGFIEKLNQATAATRPVGMAFRLPTEAEWEYACRGENRVSSRFYWGDDHAYTDITTYAWFSQNSGNATKAVGLKPANSFGLFDLSGNVREWCQDCDGAYARTSQVDPTGPVYGTPRVIRGGSYLSMSSECRSAYRDSADPDALSQSIGFRVILANIAIDHWPLWLPEDKYSDDVQQVSSLYATDGHDWRMYYQSKFVANGDYLNYATSKQFYPLPTGLVWGSDNVPMVPAPDGTYHYSPVTVAQFALYHHSNFLRGAPLHPGFWAAIDRLISLQDETGAFRYDFALGDLPAGFSSSLAQGQALSLFARAYQIRPEQRFLNAGDAAMEYMVTHISEGGVRDDLTWLNPSLNRYVFFQEWLLTPSTYTLNGFILTILGLYEWAKFGEGIGRIEASHRMASAYFDLCIETIVHLLPYYDIGGFSTYNLQQLAGGSPYPAVHPFYHALHVGLVHSLYSITGRAEIGAIRDQWAAYVNQPVP